MAAVGSTSVGDATARPAVARAGTAHTSTGHANPGHTTPASNNTGHTNPGRASTARKPATPARRRRAVGIRDRIIGHLSAIAEISDPAGMASARLAEAVGYPGSSVAFAQLLSGMERDGLIIREVRGKRTYRIALSDAAADDRVLRPLITGLRPDSRPDAAPLALPTAIDYDELARRVVVHLVRRLSGLDPAEVTTLERILGADHHHPDAEIV
jgi:hypothetical protein